VPYIRTHPTVLDKVGKQVQHAVPKDVYNDLLQCDEPGDAPRNTQSVCNKKQYEKSKGSREDDGPRYKVNFADEILHVVALTQRDEFVHGVHVAGVRVPCILLFTDRQLREVKTFCFDKKNGSILAVDKTFNLGSMYMTVTTYQNLALNRVTSGRSPTFIGPMSVHGQSDVATYNYFLSQLRSRLQEMNFTVSSSPYLVSQYSCQCMVKLAIYN